MTENKHDHKPTKKLKVCLFAFMMCLPIIAILSTTLYAIINKNAKDSFTETQITAQTELTETIMYIENKTYTFEYDYQENKTITQIGFDIATYQNCKINGKELDDTIFNQNQLSSINRITTYLSNGEYKLLAIAKTGQTLCFSKQTIDNYQTIEFIYNATGLTGTQYDRFQKNRFYKAYTYNLIQPKLDQIFYTEADRIYNKKIFAWVKQAPFTNVINSFTSIFGITETTFITYTLAYWMTITCIYVIIDIVIEIFIYITHIFNKEP